MQILSLDEVDSTQNYLKNLLREEKVQTPCAIVASKQTDGIGSRGNSWEGLDGNLFLSFALDLDKLPVDLKLESASIYFAFLLKETLSEAGSSAWLKWPNDFYIGNLKAGGMVTHIIKNKLICGVGLNLVASPSGFATLDITISKEVLLQNYFNKIEKMILWKQVFSKYKLEFHKNKDFTTHKNNVKIKLKDVSLQCDGSIISNGERIYSLR